MSFKKRNPLPVGQRINFKMIKDALNAPFIIVKHARMRMLERSFSVKDIHNVLYFARKLDRHDTGKLGDPTCRVIGYKVNGEWGAVAIAISQIKIVVITVMDNDRQKD